MPSLNKCFNKVNGNELSVPSALPFFLFGYFYYLLSPPITLLFFSENELILAAEKFISLNYFNFYYFIDVFNILIFWIVGYLLGQKINVRTETKLDVASSYNLLPLTLIAVLTIFTLFLVYKAMLSGTVFFSGYSTYEISVLGPFSTIVFMLALFINFFTKRSIRILFLILFLLVSSILLGLGSRMFFVLGSIAIMLGLIFKNPNLLKSIKFMFFSFLLLVFVLFIALWRGEGDLEFSLESIVVIFLVEPLFTATSGALYIANAGRPFLNYPVDIIASIINFIPSFIYPSKMEAINILTFDELKDSPFGASSLIVNMYSNFGFFYPIYFLLIGVFYGFLKKKAIYSSFYRAVYFSLLPLLMFHFFREGFITVFKVMFFNGFILPVFVVILLLMVFSKKDKGASISES